MGCGWPRETSNTSHNMKNTFSRRNNGLGAKEPNQKSTGSRAGALGVMLAMLVTARSVGGAVPPPEKLLPEDTLVVLTAPDFAKMREVYQKSQPSQLWNDPAMKPLREKFLTKWKEEFVQPLERELDVRFDDYTSLPQGQVTFALTQNGWQGQEDQA